MSPKSVPKTLTPSTPTTVKPKKSRAKKVVAEPVVAETVVVAEPVVAEPVVVAESSATDLHEEFTSFLTKMTQVSTALSSLRSEFRTLEKKWTRELKTAQKSVDKRKRKVGNRAPSGFVKPTLISDKMASFLGYPIGTEMARTEVTREINKYIRTHSLQDKDNGRHIIPDESLSTLLNVGDSNLTYFNLQQFMSPHFAKLGQPIPAANLATA